MFSLKVVGFKFSLDPKIKYPCFWGIYFVNKTGYLAFILTLNFTKNPVMNTLYILLVFGALLYSLYNAIIYNKRRIEDKKTTKKALASMVYHRDLTEEERRLLDELQKDSALKKTHKRIDDKVYLIKGAYKRHGIEVRHNTTWHNLIGGLEVTMDDRALDYLREVNIAEVIKTDKLPLVIGLNNDFSLLNHIVSEKQLERGELGKMAGTDVELINNRKQTAYEIQAVEKLWKGTLGAFIMVVALFFIALTSLWEVSALWGTIPGGILFLVALYFVWRKPKYSKPMEVRVMKGIPTYSAILDAAQNIKGVKVFMGNTELKYDGSWLPFIVYDDDDTVINVEVTSDGWLMRFGQYLSLGEEEKRFPSKAWYRHSIIAIAATIAVIVTYFSAPDLTNHFAADIIYRPSIFKALYLYAPAIFLGLNLILIIVHGPLAIKGYQYSKQRQEDIREYYAKLIPLK